VKTNNQQRRYFFAAGPGSNNATHRKNTNEGGWWWYMRDDIPVTTTRNKTNHHPETSSLSRPRPTFYFYTSQRTTGSSESTMMQLLLSRRDEKFLSFVRQDGEGGGCPIGFQKRGTTDASSKRRLVVSHQFYHAERLFALFGAKHSRIITQLFGAGSACSKESCPGNFGRCATTGALFKERFDPRIRGVLVSYGRQWNHNHITFVSEN